MRKEDKLRGLVGGIVLGFILMSFFYSCFALVIAAEGTTDTRWDSLFTEESPDPCCWHDDSGTAFWVYMGGGIYASVNDCYRTTVASGCKNDCCDTSYTCDTTANRCISSEIIDCGDYRNETDCIADASNVAVSSVNAKTDNLGYCQGMSIGEEWSAGDGVFCGNYTNSCRCAWKSGKCTADYNITKMCTSGPSEVLGTCSFSISELTNCSTGFRTMKWIGTWTPITAPLPDGASCDDGEKNLPCPAQLSFISTVGIIIAVILLVVLYFVMSRKKKTNTKLKSKKKNG